MKSKIGRVTMSVFPPYWFRQFELKYQCVCVCAFVIICESNNLEKSFYLFTESSSSPSFSPFDFQSSNTLRISIATETKHNKYIWNGCKCRLLLNLIHKFFSFILPNMAYRFVLYRAQYINLPYANKRGENDFSGWNYYITPFDPSNRSMRVYNSTQLSFFSLSNAYTIFEMDNEKLLRFNSIKIIKRITEFCESFIPIWPFILDIEHWITWYSVYFHFRFRSSCHSRWIAHLPSAFVWISIHLTQK